MSEENKGKNKGHDNLIPLKKGETANPNGRPKGQRNYKTIYREALTKIGEAEGKTPEEIETMMEEVGLKQGLKGNFNFWKDVRDRVHGQPTKKVEFDGNVIIRGAKDVAQSLQGILNENNTETKESHKDDNGDLLQE